MLFYFNQNLEIILQTITISLGVLLYMRVDAQNEGIKLLHCMLISLIYTTLTAKFYQDLNPSSEDGTRSISSIFLLSIDYYYLFLTGIITSLFWIIFKTIRSNKAPSAD